MNEKDLQRLYPYIPWRQPVRVHLFGQKVQRYCCRICIARFGIKRRDIITFGFRTRRDFEQHLEDVHG